MTDDEEARTSNENERLKHVLWYARRDMRLVRDAVESAGVLHPHYVEQLGRTLAMLEAEPLGAQEARTEPADSEVRDGE